MSRAKVVIQEGQFEDGEPRIRVFLNDVNVVDEPELRGSHLKELLTGLGFSCVLQAGEFRDPDEGEEDYQFDCRTEER